MTSSRLLLVHARSPLHAGTGQSTAAIDLPIARDRATGLPLLPGSSLKGALRARARAGDATLSKHWQTTFGPETENASDFGGAVAFSDMRLLLMPVRSVAGTFGWATSPLLLASAARDARLCGLELSWGGLPQPRVEQAAVARDSMLKHTSGGTTRVILEEFDLQADAGAGQAVAKALAPLVFPDDPEWQKLLEKRLCIVHDDVMAFFAHHATEVVTRVSIDPETGTAKQGQLWTEENLPAESVLSGIVEELPSARVIAAHQGQHLDRIQNDLLDRPIQLGGKASIGRGRCVLEMHGGQA